MMREMMLKSVNAIYWLLLSLWFGGLVMVTVVAALIFPAVADLDPQVPRFAAFDGPHAPIVAGTVMNQVFFVLDVVQLLAAAGTTVILALHLTLFGMPIRRPANVIRTLTMVGLIGGLLYHLFVLAPRMNVNLCRFWTEAATGNTDSAEQFRAAFAADHPTATLVMSVIGVGLLVMIVASAAALTTPEEGRDLSIEEPRSPLEEPLLVRGTL